MFNDVLNLWIHSSLNSISQQPLMKYCIDNVQVGCLHPISCCHKCYCHVTFSKVGSWLFLYHSPFPAMVFALLLLCLSVYVSVCPSPVQLTSERDKLREAEKSISERNSKVGVLPTSPSLPSMLKAATCLHLWKSAFFFYLLTGWSKLLPLSDQAEPWFSLLSQDSQQMLFNHPLQMHATQLGHTPFNISSI